MVVDQIFVLLKLIILQIGTFEWKELQKLVWKNIQILIQQHDIDYVLHEKIVLDESTTGYDTKKAKDNRTVRRII